MKSGAKIIGQRLNELEKQKQALNEKKEFMIRSQDIIDDIEFQRNRQLELGFDVTIGDLIEDFIDNQQEYDLNGINKELEIIELLINENKNLLTQMKKVKLNAKTNKKTRNELSSTKLNNENIQINKNLGREKMIEQIKNSDKDIQKVNYTSSVIRAGLIEFDSSKNVMDLQIGTGKFTKIINDLREILENSRNDISMQFDDSDIMILEDKIENLRYQMIEYVTIREKLDNLSIADQFDDTDLDMLTDRLVEINENFDRSIAEFTQNTINENDSNLRRETKENSNEQGDNKEEAFDLDASRKKAIYVAEARYANLLKRFNEEDFEDFGRTFNVSGIGKDEKISEKIFEDISKEKIDLGNITVGEVKLSDNILRAFLLKAMDRELRDIVKAAIVLDNNDKALEEKELNDSVTNVLVSNFDNIYDEDGKIISPKDGMELNDLCSNFVEIYGSLKESINNLVCEKERKMYIEGLEHTLSTIKENIIIQGHNGKFYNSALNKLAEDDGKRLSREIKNSPSWKAYQQTKGFKLFGIFRTKKGYKEYLETQVEAYNSQIDEIDQYGEDIKEFINSEDITTFERSKDINAFNERLQEYMNQNNIEILKNEYKATRKEVNNHSVRVTLPVNGNLLSEGVRKTLTDVTIYREQDLKVIPNGTGVLGIFENADFSKIFPSNPKANAFGKVDLSSEENQKPFVTDLEDELESGLMQEILYNAGIINEEPEVVDENANANANENENVDEEDFGL